MVSNFFFEIACMRYRRFFLGGNKDAQMRFFELIIVRIEKNKSLKYEKSVRPALEISISMEK